MHLGICLFVDIIANAREQSLFLFSFVLPVFLNGLNSQDYKIRQGMSSRKGVWKEGFFSFLCVASFIYPSF
jgi:hypothetical protein